MDLSSWGRVQVDRRLRAIDSGDPDRTFIYDGSGSDYQRQASSCVAIGQVLRWAGLADEPDVRPASVAASTGRQILAETGRIDEVTRRLGIRSLDRAARFICWDWHEPDTPPE